MKSFKQFSEEVTSTANVAGTGSDVADWMPPKKKKRRYPISRRYIEVLGKVKKQVK